MAERPASAEPAPAPPDGKVAPTREAEAPATRPGAVAKGRGGADRRAPWCDAMAIHANTLSRRLSALQCLTDPTLSLLPVHQLLDRLVERTRRTLRVDEASLLVVSDDDPAVLQVRASRGLSKGPDGDAPQVVPIGRGFAGRVARERRAIVAHDLREDEVVRPALRSLRSIIGVPLLARGRLVGVLHVGTREHREFAPEDVELLLLVGDRAAYAIDRARAFEALGRSEERLALALDAACLGTFDVDPATGAVMLDARARELIGVEAGAETTLDGLLARVHPEDRGGACAELERALAPGSGGVFSSEVRLEATKRWILSRGRVFFARDKPVRFIGTVMDVTARREAEQEVGRLNADLESRVASRTRELEITNTELQAFSDSVSHDLRAPLRAIAGFGAVLAESASDRLTPAERRNLERIRSAATRASAMVEDLLGLSRVGQRPLAAEAIDLAEIARESVAALRQTDPERRIDVRIPARLPAHGDPGLARILLDNLLGNAWKFSRPAADPMIELGVEPGGGRAPVYFVRDNGVGFDPSAARRIFRPFERFHERSSFEGTGIGLATAERIVARHGGMIWADAMPGQGATFRFTLPRASPSAP